MSREGGQSTLKDLLVVTEAELGFALDFVLRASLSLLHSMWVWRQLKKVQVVEASSRLEDHIE